MQRAQRLKYGEGNNKVPWTAPHQQIRNLVKGKVLQKKGFVSGVAIRRLTSSKIRKGSVFEFMVLNADTSSEMCLKHSARCSGASRRHRDVTRSRGRSFSEKRSKEEKI